jgi:hypothetical protein
MNGAAFGLPRFFVAAGILDGRCGVTVTQVIRGCRGA